jgi:hypothetical protein
MNNLATILGHCNHPTSNQSRFFLYTGAGLDDFDAVSMNVTLTPVMRRQCVDITIVPDLDFEPHETFQVVISRNSLPPYVVLSPNAARITIYDS